MRRRGNDQRPKHLVRCQQAAIDNVRLVLDQQAHRLDDCKPRHDEKQE